MSVQFGLATMRMDGQIVGYLQNVNVDFGYDIATLYGGKGMFPVDVRVHTGNITGSAEFANLTAVGVEKLLGGTREGLSTSVAISNTSSPGSFAINLTLTTDSITFEITLNKCRSTSLAFPYARDSHVIPSFDFSAEADSNGSVGTIAVGDLS